MKTRLLTLLVAGALMGTPAAFAADTGFYVGGSAGQSKANDLDAADIDAELALLGIAGATTLDDSDLGWKVFAGYQLSKNFAIEGAYVDAGEWTAHTVITSPGVGVADSSIEAQTWGIAVVGILPLGESFSLFGKVGYHTWEADSEAVVVVDGITGVGSVSDDGSDPFYGLGVGYTFGGNFAIRAEWERFEFDDDSADLLTLGLSYRF